MNNDFDVIIKSMKENISIEKITSTDINLKKIMK